MLAAACRRTSSRVGAHQPRHSLLTRTWQLPRRSLSVDKAGGKPQDQQLQSRERQRQLQLERKQRKLQKQQQLKQQAKKAQQKKSKKKPKPKPPGPPVNLPRTEFPMRADAARRELNYLARCTSDLYAWQERERPADGPRFVLHDGPPFANGVPHMGHALNKVIKDIINRYRLLRGDRISYVPGWDCHGLPIELKALHRLPGDASRSIEDIPAVAVRSAARKEAEAAIVAQREQFERWGVMGDWERSYLTMTPEYEARQLRIFRRMVEQGLIYRALRPVHWSPSAMTALAEAELEYNDAHCSRAVYVRFLVDQASPAVTASGLASHDCPRLSLVAWTTTPWSLVGNQALCVHPDLEYSVVESSAGERYVVATERVAALEKAFGEFLEVQSTLYGTDMVGWECMHPLPSVGGRRPVLPAAHVTADSGTGIVHTAPAHGYDDFVVCKEHGIEPICPVDERGCFTCEGNHIPWAGQAALGAGTESVIGALKDAGMLVMEHEYIHSYACILRKPTQYFSHCMLVLGMTMHCSLHVIETDLSDLQQKAAEALSHVDIMPASGRKRLSGMVSSRQEWCISRQRSWGVPIPAFYDAETGEVLLNENTMKHFEKCVAEHGSDCWWTMTVEELLPAEYQDGRQWNRGYDTLDVWFDSGTSWFAALQPRLSADATLETADPQHAVAASLCVEGSDQHRGWFQSSLLTSVASNGRAPYERMLSHGFVLDEDGRKMSKSIGNVMDPAVVIEGGPNKKQEPAYGADVIRVWAASTDYTRDVVIGPTTLAAASSTLRKLRNTARFALGNLHDFNPAVNAVCTSELPLLEQFILHRLDAASDDLTAAYDSLNFAKVQTVLMQLATSDLSSFYFDVIKDRLYCDRPDSHRRRSAQTVLRHALDTLTKALAPIAPFAAEDITDHLPLKLRSATAEEPHSVFRCGWLAPSPEWRNDELARQWEILLDVRAEVNVALDAARQAKIIGSSLEAEIELTVPRGTRLAEVISMLTAEELAELLIVSRGAVVLTDSDHIMRASTAEKVGDTVTATSAVSTSHDSSVSLRIGVSAADGSKCGRCWRIVPELVTVAPETDHEPGQVCGRCNFAE